VLLATTIVAVQGRQAPGGGTQTPAAQSPATAAFNQGVQLHDSGKFAEAIEPFSQAVALGFQPINQARFRLARALAKAGQIDRALTELETLAAALFRNTAVLTMPDLDPLRGSPRFAAFEARVKANAHPCDTDPNFRAFDFWLGEWDVQPTSQARGPMGTGSSSVIERQLDGCVIQETWLPLGGVGLGKSLNIYNVTTKQWEQYYVDSNGTITLYKGTFHADGHLYFEADQFGSPNKIRMTFFNQGNDQVRQLGHTSTDGGKTWAVSFDFTYRRKPAPQAPHIMMTSPEFDWTKSGAPATGLQLLHVDGDPSTEGAPFSIRLRLPDGFVVAPHWHPVDEHVVVVQGTAMMGMGDTVDRATAREMPAGAYGMMPKEMHHYFYAKGETILHVYGIGPFKTFWVKP
jgi:mannose-6-phosphate isomerase-like protein (cupin superfamily)